MKIDWKILKANADTERAQLNRILEDIKASIKNEAQATLQAANIQATLLSGEGISGMASAWRETFAKVTQLEGGVNALSQDVTALEVKVYDPATGLDATASAVQAMSVEVDTLSGLVMSSYTLALDVNGYIVGWKFTNDGTTGIVDFRADRFRISAPGSIKSVEFADGLLKSVNATHNLYMGAGFGVGDSMVMWYGTTALPSAASSSNGLFWIKNDGTAYFGGGLSNTVVANLPIVSTTVNRINNTGGGRSIEQVASAVLSTEAAIEGKADSGAFLALQSKVNNSTTGLDTKASSSALLSVQSRALFPNQNQMPNPSGEDGINGWTGAGLSQLTIQDVGTGLRYRLVNPEGGATRVSGEMMRCFADRDFTVSMKLLRQLNDSRLRISIYFYDSTGTYAGSTPLARPGATGWTDVISTGMSPSNADSMRVNIQWDAGPAETIYFYQIKVEQASSPTAFTNEALGRDTALRTRGNAAANLALASDVSTLDGVVSAQGTAILGVSAAVEGANILQIANPSFEESTGWLSLGTGAGDVHYSGASPHSGSFCLRFNTTSASKYIRNGLMGRCTPGTVIRFVWWNRATGTKNSACTVRFGVTRFDQNKGTVESNKSLWTTNLTNISGWVRNTAEWLVEDDTFYYRVFVATTNGTSADGTSDANLYFDDISGEILSVESSQAATVTQALTAGAGPGGAWAQATMTLDVNGRITGTKLTATGTQTDFAILADKFSIVSPSGGARTEYSNGNWRVYDASGVLRVRLGVW